MVQGCLRPYRQRQFDGGGFLLARRRTCASCLCHRFSPSIVVIGMSGAQHCLVAAIRNDNLYLMRTVTQAQLRTIQKSFIAHYLCHLRRLRKVQQEIPTPSYFSTFFHVGLA
jgi:hypothetical protein